jgi:hypothetical protein
MRRFFQCKQMFLCAGVLAVALGLSSNVHAWSHNEHNVNNNSTTAYDVVKILDGDYEISAMMDWDFSSQDYYHVSIGSKVYTVLRWWNGQVPPGTAGDVCFTAEALGSHSAPRAEIVAAWWTGPTGMPIGNYIPEISVDVAFDRLVNQKWNPDITFKNNQFAEIAAAQSNPNRWADGDFVLSGQAAPILMHTVRAAAVPGALTPETLTIENLTANYNYPTGFQVLNTPTALPYGVPFTTSSSTLSVGYGESLVVVADLGGGNYKLYNFEAPVLSSASVLGLSAGVPIGVLLLAMAGLFVVRRRRRHPLA